MTLLIGAELDEKAKGPSWSEHTLQSSEESVENHGTGILIGRLQKWLLVLTGVGGNEEEMRVKKYEMVF